MLPEPFINTLRSASATTPEGHEVLAMLLKREERREKSGLNALMAKYTEARAQGLDITERDKRHLLALLLDEVLRGTGTAGYEKKSF